MTTQVKSQSLERLALLTVLLLGIFFLFNSILPLIQGISERVSKSIQIEAGQVAVRKR